MANWTDLEQSLRDAGRRRTDELRLAEERVRARRMLDAWAFAVVPAVMDQVARACVIRSRATGLGDAFPLHVVAIRLDPVEVDVYSARGPGRLPVLHVVSYLRTTRSRERRLVSEPGCLVARLADCGWQLLSLEPHGAPTTLDDLVHRAFTRLVRHWTTGLVSAQLS